MPSRKISLRDSMAICVVMVGLLVCGGAGAQEAVTVIPQPAKVTVRAGEFVLKKDTRIVVVEGEDASANERVREIAQQFVEWVAPATNFKLQIANFRLEEKADAQSASYNPRTTSRKLRTTNFGARTTDRELRTTNFGPRATDSQLRSDEKRIPRPPEAWRTRNDNRFADSPEAARPPKNVIILRLDPALERLGGEGYALRVTRERVEIRAFAPAGIFYGVQTLRQLFPPEIFATAEKAKQITAATEAQRNQKVEFRKQNERPRFTAENAENLSVGAPLGAPDWNLPFFPFRTTVLLDNMGAALRLRSGSSTSSAPANGNTATPKTIRWAAPCVEIEDRPRFAWRGAHMDVVRHFMPKEFVLKFIDVMAAHKLNTFHWHLTDDQGWRIEIKKYPRLTAVGAWRKETRVGRESATAGFDGVPHGGFYTQQEIREVVEYARRRFVTVVPEIEMPGHAQAAIAAYPELGTSGAPVEVMTYWGVSKEIFNVEESTIAFLQDVLAEVLELFPSKFIHIGGDEAEKEQWRASSRVQQRMRELGVKDENELQSWFIRRMDTFLTERGRRLIGWDEILDGGLAEGATVMSWRGVKGGIEAAKAGHDVVMAPSQYTYFDHYQSRGADEPLAIGGFTPLEKIYLYEPIPDALSAEEAKRVLGAQAQLWSEYIASPKHLEYMAFPRLCALAEVVWSPRELRVWPNFLWRLRVHVARLQRLGVHYRSPNKPVVPPPSNR